MSIEPDVYSIVLPVGNPRARRVILTPNGLTSELMYSADLDILRERTEYVLDSVRGFNHMIGDTNASYPSYPWENIQTVIDVVRDRGRLFE